MTCTECCRKVAARAPHNFAVAFSLVQSSTVSRSGMGAYGPKWSSSSDSCHGVNVLSEEGTLSGTFLRNSLIGATSFSLICDWWLLLRLSKNCSMVSCVSRVDSLLDTKVKETLHSVGVQRKKGKRVELQNHQIVEFHFLDYEDKLFWVKGGVALCKTPTKGLSISCL